MISHRNSNLVIGFAILFALCAAPTVGQVPEEQPTPQPRWKSTIEVARGGEFDRSIKVGGQKRTADTLYGQPAKKWQLISIVNKSTGALTHVLCFNDSYEGRGWRFWKYADTDDAQALKVTTIGRDVVSCGGNSGCVYTEGIAVDPSEPLLEKRAESGLRIRVGGSGVTSIVAITPDEIADQLAAARFESERLSKK